MKRTRLTSPADEREEPRGDAQTQALPVRVHLATRRETHQATFVLFRKQARIMYNYPGNMPAWLATTTPGREALINVTCNVHDRAIGKPRVLDRRLQCFVRDSKQAPRLLYSAPLEHDQIFMQRIEADFCQITAVHAIIHVNRGSLA